MQVLLGNAWGLNQNTRVGSHTNIGNWAVFMDSTVEPEIADGKAGDEYKVGICIPNSNQEELAKVLSASKSLGDSPGLLGKVSFPH